MLENFGINGLPSKVASLTSSFDMALGKYAANTLALVSPAILVSSIIFGIFFFTIAYTRKHPDRDIKTLLTFGTAVAGLIVPSLLSGSHNGRLWIAFIFAALYITISPIAIKVIFRSSNALSPQWRIALSILKVIVLSLALLVIIGVVIHILSPHTQQIGGIRLYSLTIFCSQLHLWVILNAGLAILWAWKRKHQETHSQINIISRIPYFVAAPVFLIVSGITLFTEWMPHIHRSTLVLGTSLFLIILAAAVSSALWFTFEKIAKSICKRLFSEGVQEIFPIHKSIILIFVASAIIAIAHLFDAYNLWLHDKPTIIRIVEQAVLRIVIAFTLFSLINHGSQHIRKYFQVHAIKVKRISGNRRLLSASTFIQGLAPVFLKLIATVLTLVILGVPFYYIVSTFILIILFLSFIGKKFLEDVTQGLLHTLFGGHLAVGDLIEVQAPSPVLGFVENMTLHNLTIRARATGALHVIAFSDLRNFTHHDREHARVLAFVHLPFNVPWNDFSSYVDRAMLMVQQHPVHGQFFLGHVTQDIEDFDKYGVTARIGFETLTGDARQFTLRRFFLTTLKTVLDEYNVNLSPKMVILEEK